MPGWGPRTCRPMEHGMSTSSNGTMQREPLDVLAAQIAAITQQEQELRLLLLSASEEVAQRERDVETALHRLTESVQQALEHGAPRTSGGASVVESAAAADPYTAYQEHIHHIRE